MYADAPRLLNEEGVHVVSTDEKTGIQALEHLHPRLPMLPGIPERREHEYERHGTRCLIASLEVATGRVIRGSLGPTRTSEDFAGHIARTIATPSRRPPGGSSWWIGSTPTNRRLWSSWWPRRRKRRSAP